MRIIVRLCGAVLLAASLTAQAFDDRENSTPTAAAWYVNQTPAQVNALAAAGWRLTDIEIESTSPWSFTVAAVPNAGSYQTSWAWYYDITASALSAALTQNQARLIDIEPYDAGGQTKFAAIMVNNTGANARTWGWLYDTTTTAITQNVNQFTNRVVDLERYSRGGSTYYAAVLTSNTGVHARNWWLGFGLSATQLAQQVQQNAAQIVDLERNGSSSYDVVMQQVPGGPGWWYGLGMTAQGVTAALSQNGARAIDIQPYSTLLGMRYHVVMINASNELTTQVGNILRAGTDGVSGCYLKEVGGAVLADLQAAVPFEPASTIKVLFHAHAIRQVQVGNASLSTPIIVPSTVVGGCYQWTNTTTHPLSFSLDRMMKFSDNDHTIGVQGHFTNAAIQQTASNLLQLGMTNTVLNRFDCQGPLNESTLIDFGRLYERVHNGWLNQTHLDHFHDLMLTQVGMGSTNLNGVVDQEAAALSLPTALVPYFKSLMAAAWKDGNYDRVSVHHVSICGWLSLPFRTGGQLTPRTFVTGTFVDLATNNQAASTTLYQAQRELLRGLIREALQTWTNYTGPTMQYYGTGCTGTTATPLISSGGGPIQLGQNLIGGTAGYRLVFTPPGTLAVCVIGLSNTVYGTTPLPMSLTPFGATSCNLLASVDATVWRTTDANGQTSYTFPVPHAPALIGLPLYGQWLVHDVGANPANLTATGGARITLGGFQ